MNNILLGRVSGKPLIMIHFRKHIIEMNRQKYCLKNYTYTFKHENVHFVCGDDAKNDSANSAHVVHRTLRELVVIKLSVRNTYSTESVFV